MANTLAKHAGYVVRAVDLFKGQSTKDPNQAMQLVKIVTDNPQESIPNLHTAVKYVSSLPPILCLYRTVFTSKSLSFVTTMSICFIVLMTFRHWLVRFCKL
jgi:hypothetical protein